MTTNCTSTTISSDFVPDITYTNWTPLCPIISINSQISITCSPLMNCRSIFAGMPSYLCCWLAVQLNRKTPLESTVAIYCWFNLIFNLLKKMFQWKVIIFSEDQATGSCSWTWGQFDVWVLEKNQTKNIERKLHSLCGYQVAINTAFTVLSLNPRAGVV